jgi:hypothetical protein
MYSSRKALLQPGEKPSFVLMLTERLQQLPALLPFGALLLLTGRDLVVTILGPAVRHASDVYQRRKRRLERLQQLKLRKQATFAPFIRRTISSPCVCAAALITSVLF